MQTLKLNDDLASQLQQTAKHAHLSANELIAKLLKQYNTNSSPLLTDIMNDLPNIDAFNTDPVTLQRAMRNEWD